jgi:hypothetical protein
MEQFQKQIFQPKQMPKAVNHQNAWWRCLRAALWKHGSKKDSPQRTAAALILLLFLLR